MPEMLRVRLIVGLPVTVPEVGFKLKLYGRYSVVIVECRILLASIPVSYNPSSSPMKNVTGNQTNNPRQQRKMIDVLALTSTGLEGSRFPKFSAEVSVVNQQVPLDMTVAVTDTELESAAYPMPAVTKIERIRVTIGIVFNWKPHFVSLIQPMRMIPLTLPLSLKGRGRV
jgi:hypothetical protein